MADPLMASLADLCGALRGLQEQVEQLTHVHEAIDDFNAAFGAFQGAMAVHASCLEFPKPPTPAAAPRGAKKAVNALPKDKELPQHTGIPLPGNMHVSPAGSAVQSKGGASSAGKTSASSNAAIVAATSTGKGNPRKLPMAGIKRSGKPEPHDIREKIPRKYQNPAELKKLENIVLYIKNRHSAMSCYLLLLRVWSFLWALPCGSSIADLVKHSGLAVIRCKEILQTLMKLELIERKREKAVRS
ncbi:hypothetical protein BBJ28_00006803 [Nothophytophthora sp. Chile5]|nr:hypothetical protein BBJ28_00006803 [Nothophytophthora sp. Chile5]